MGKKPAEKQPTRKQLKQQLWKIKVAEHCMTKVQELCHECSQRNPQADSAIGYALMSAICTTYARPFINNDELGQISEKFGRFKDPEKAKVHKLLLDSRNKLFAHQDPKHAKVRIDVRAVDQGTAIEYQFFHGLLQDYMATHRTPLIHDLCADVLKKLETQRDKLLERLFGGTHWPPGVIVLNLDDES